MKIMKKIIVKLNLLRSFTLFFYVMRIFPIKKNKIVFVNFSGKGYGDSPKYLCEKLLKEKDNYDIVWLVNDLNDNFFPREIRKVKIFSFKSFFELSTAKFWINNSRFDLFVSKRKNQIYFQTWHGGLALKKIEYDAYDSLSDYYRRVMKNDNKMIDYMVSNSSFCSSMFRRSFKYNGKIIEYGTPRNDCLVNLDIRNEICNKIRKVFNLNTEKVLLYAPTFRSEYNNNPYDIDLDLVKSTLETVTGFYWKVFVRLHPRISNSSHYIKNIDNYINVSNYSDIQELICLSDLIITDYSSIMFEAGLAEKDVVLYANDITSYNEDRGMYFNFNDLPFPIATNKKDLVQIIELKKFKNKESINKFFKKAGLSESGKCCIKIIDIIKESKGDTI